MTVQFTSLQALVLPSDVSLIIQPDRRATLHFNYTIQKIALHCFSFSILVSLVLVSHTAMLSFGFIFKRSLVDGSKLKLEHPSITKVALLQARAAPLPAALHQLHTQTD